MTEKEIAVTTHVDEKLLASIEMAISNMAETWESAIRATHYHESDKDEAAFWAYISDLRVAQTRLEVLAFTFRVAINRAA